MGGADWIPGVGVGFFGSALAWLLSWRINSAHGEGINEAEHVRLSDSDEGLRQDMHDLRDELRGAAAELRGVAAATAKLQASQDVVNKVTAKAIESLELKMENHDRAISDHAATLRLVTELLTKRSGEALKP
jgi:hypothetical protein